MFISNESVSDEYMVDWGERLGCGMNGSVRSAKSRSTGDECAVKVKKASSQFFNSSLGHSRSTASSRRSGNARDGNGPRECCSAS